MNLEFASSEVDDRLCEAAGCNERAVTIIRVKVDRRDSIPLFVCNSCVNKFSQESTSQTKNKRHLPPVLTGGDSYAEAKVGTDWDLDHQT
jgi:protein-arginine kinase activator protein McsA